MKKDVLFIIRSKDGDTVRLPIRTVVYLRLGVLLGMFAVGCDGQSQAVREQLDTQSGADTVVFASASISPRSLCDECVAAYQRLESYEDDSFVHFEYEIEGETHTDQAPMAVAYDGQGKLGLQVYSVTAGPDENRWRLRLNSARAGSAERRKGRVNGLATHRTALLTGDEIVVATSATPVVQRVNRMGTIESAKSSTRLTRSIVRARGLRESGPAMAPRVQTGKGRADGPR